MTNKEFSAHFSNAFTKSIKDFGTDTLLHEGFDCLIVTDREDKEKAFCTHCKKWVKIPGNTIHTGSPKSIQAAERREYYMHCCHGVWGMTKSNIIMETAAEEKRAAMKKRKYAICPECKFRYSVYHQWRMNMSQLDGVVSISVWAKSKVEPGAVVMRRIEIDREYGNGTEPVVKDTYKEAERYLFRMGKKTVRQNCNARGHWEYDEKSGWLFVRSGKRIFVKSIIDRAVRQSTVMWTDYIKGNYRMDLVSLRTAIRNTPYFYLFNGKQNYIRHYKQYEYRESYPIYTVGLMDLYSLHPWVELLLKNGMENIVIDHIRGAGEKGAICWGAKTIKSAVKRFTKQDMKDVMALNAGQTQVTEKDLAFLAEAREKFMPKMTVAEAVVCYKEGRETLSHVWERAKGLKVKPERVVAYCLKHCTGYHKLGDWLDYIADAGKIGLDLTQGINIFPKDIYTLHANISRQIKYKHDKELAEKLKATLALRENLFHWEGEKYIIRPAVNTDELIEEGKALHHCVGGYAQRHANGETNILFIRKKEQPDASFVTMEVKKGTKDTYYVAQIHGYLNDKNNPLPKEVEELADYFIGIVNDRAKKLNKKARKLA